MEFAARSSILCAFHNEAIVRCEMRLLNELRRRADGLSYLPLDKPKKRAMKKHLLLAVSLSALVAYAVIVCVGYFHARAEIADEACGVDCLVQRVDALTKKD
jgi:hypothetical protein